MAKKEKCVTAFSDGHTTAIENAITNLETRVRCTLSTPNIEYRQLFQLVAPPEHIDILMDARKIVNINNYSGTALEGPPIINYRGYDVNVKFEVSGGEDSPVMPRRPIWLDHMPENRSLMADLTRSAKEHVDIMLDWISVRRLFYILNTECKKPQQVQYLWPAITGIMSASERLNALRNTMGPRTLPRSLPTLPPEVRAMCRTTAATIAMALMLPPLEDEPTAVRPVEVSFQAVESTRFLADQKSTWRDYY